MARESKILMTNSSGKTLYRFSSTKKTHIKLDALDYDMELKISNGVT